MSGEVLTSEKGRHFAVVASHVSNFEEPTSLGGSHSSRIDTLSEPIAGKVGLFSLSSWIGLRGASPILFQPALSSGPCSVSYVLCSFAMTSFGEMDPNKVKEAQAVSYCGEQAKQRPHLGTIGRFRAGKARSYPFTLHGYCLSTLHETISQARLSWSE